MQNFGKQNERQREARGDESPPKVDFYGLNCKQMKIVKKLKK